MLKEVKVSAQRLLRSGDTLTYSVSSFRQGQDRSLADVITKMPGLEVKANGQIEYQGKAISKFYIEGLDYFLDGAVSYKSKRWELSFTANNLIGTSAFERRALSNTLISYNVTRLRPREFLLKWSFDI